MNGSAHFLKLVWDSASKSEWLRRGRNREAYNPVYAALEEIYQIDPREARRMIRQMLRDHTQVKSGGIVRGPAQRRRQLELFARPQAQVPEPKTVTSEKIIPWRGLVLLEQHSRPCPRCGHALTQRSRVGASIYYTCPFQGCPNTQALFLLILGTGDD